MSAEIEPQQDPVYEIRSDTAPQFSSSVQIEARRSVIEYQLGLISEGEFRLTTDEAGPDGRAEMRATASRVQGYTRRQLREEFRSLIFPSGNDGRPTDVVVGDTPVPTLGVMDGIAKKGHISRISLTRNEDGSYSGSPREMKHHSGSEVRVPPVKPTNQAK